MLLLTVLPDEIIRAVLEYDGEHIYRTKYGRTEIVRIIPILDTRRELLLSIPRKHYCMDSEIHYESLHRTEVVFPIIVKNTPYGENVSIYFLMIYKETEDSACIYFYKFYSELNHLTMYSYTIRN